MVRSIGADNVIDYSQGDFAKSGEQYDLIFDAVAKRSFLECKPALKPQGIYITTAYSPVLALRGLWNSMIENQKLVPLPPKPPNQSDLEFLAELLESEKVKPVIDITYPLSDVPDALRYLETGHARGKIIITV
jgi:NADPH:quinone reductase-like Zn-dependent oxidoreductase